MRILELLPSIEEFHNGIWFYRNRTPGNILRERGHQIMMVALTSKVEEDWYKMADVAFFRGLYATDPIPVLRRFKQLGVKVVYDSDDDVFTVNPDNAAAKASKEKLEQYAALLSEADVITTTTEVLRQRFLKFNNNVVVIPNALDFSEFRERKRASEMLRIGWSGSPSHWGDLEIVLPVIDALQKKYPFKFVIQGLTSSPLIAEIYNYKYYYSQGLQPEHKEYFESAFRVFSQLQRLNYVHIPWYPPEIYPEVLSGLDLDIGICPLKDNAFNQAKSCIKFYEYVACGTVCLASDVLPYSTECPYRARNTFRDWYNKLEKLITDERFREKILKKEWAFVEANRNIRQVVKQWENVFYVPPKS